MPDYSELLNRIEQASGPDRELDVAICLALNYVGPHMTHTISNLRLDEYAEPCDFEWLIYECYDDGGTIPECTDPTPGLTASLDSTVALVERMLPGQHWTLGRNVHHHYWLCTFNSVDLDNGEIQSTPSHAAPKPSLALLSALFRALSAREAKDGE